MRNLPVKNTKEWHAISPFQELENLQREMNRLFDLTFPKIGDMDATLLGGQWAPAIDIYDSKDNIVVKADLPGLDKDNIDISIQDNLLTIKGEKKQKNDVKEEDYIRSERFYGSFHRSLTLPTDVDSTNVKATFKDGVLELVLPKKEEAKPKQIKINVS